MYKGCIWLPEPIKFEYPLESDETLDKLYKLFLENYYKTTWKYKEKIVYVRKTPEYKGKFEAFFHIISDKNLNGHEYYTINKERAERLLWGKAILENEPCSSNCENCDKIFVWKYTHYTNTGSRERLKIYHKKFSYLIILESRDDKWLYITSYRIGNAEDRRKIIAEYKKQRTLNHN